MLNEIQEYKEYSFDTLSDPMNESLWRLKYRSFITNSFAGIERALITVARKHLFSENGKVTKEAGYAAIRLWCGIESEELKPENQHLAQWMSKYIKNCHLRQRIDEYSGYIKTKGSEILPAEFVQLTDSISCELEESELFDIYEKISKLSDDLSKDEKKELKDALDKITSILKCIEALKKIDRKKRAYSHQMFSFDSGKKDNKGANDLKTITFDEIVAKAYVKGPLKKYYLCCNNPDVLNCITVGAKGKEKSIFKKNGKKHQDIILKTVAAFLISQRESSEPQNYVFFNKTDTVNWMADLNLNKDYDKYLANYTIDAKGPITDVKKIGDNALKITICDTLRQSFVLKDEDTIEEWIKDNPNGVYYLDMGANHFMEEATCSNPLYYCNFETKGRVNEG